MYTHFACADEADKSSTREQLRRFLAAVESCGGRSGLILHAANSAATIDLPDTHLDMIRPGMVMYGYQPGQSIHNHLPLQPCLRLMAPIVQLKDVPAGAATGYGLTYRFDHDARVALVPIGYADGYFRSLSNRAVMQVGGANCPIRGRISMDQTIIEVTHVPDVHIGQMADIISNDPDAPNSVDSLAEMASTIPYEIVPRLGDRITRVVVS
jgi:alanine racemase